MNTTNHFIIQDCLFTSPVYGYTSFYLVFPVTLVNVSNAKFIDNQVLNGDGGISGYKLSNCIISDNRFNASATVISLRYSNFTTIHNNTQEFDPCHHGMILAGCQHSVVSLNSLKIVKSIGISSISVYNVSFVDNTIMALEADDDPRKWYRTMIPINGIELWSGNNCTLRGNEIVDFGWSGIELLGSDYIVEYNNISANQCGILIAANSSVVRHNTLSHNLNSIEMVNSNFTMVYSNEMRGRGIYEAGIVTHGGFDCDIYLNDVVLVNYGIVLQGSTRFNISNNRVSDGRYGFAFNWYGTSYPSEVENGPSFDCDILYNTFDRGGVYSTIDNYDSWDFNSIRFIGNTVNGRPIGFYAYLNDAVISAEDYGQLVFVSCSGNMIFDGDFSNVCSDVVIPLVNTYYHDAGQASAITLINCSYTLLEDIILHNNTIGINMQYCSNCNVSDGTGYHNSWAAAILWYSNDCYFADVYWRSNLKGIAIGWSRNCEISGCQIWDNGEAIDVVNSPFCKISNNSIFLNQDAILLANSDGCEILNNSIYWNSRGILLNDSSNCLISQNGIYYNTGVGISIDLTSNMNEIYNNVFAYNLPNAICLGTSNHWDNQVDTGNWWSDWNGEGPYIIDEDDRDNFPIDNRTIPLLIDLSIINQLLLVFAGAGVGVIALAIIIIDRRRIVIIDQ
ncbi:MAG: NosD domain-containing protein [Candidatus Thorarchaeota archaeon]